MNFVEGEIISLYKPIRWTSFDVVKKVRNLIRKSIGGQEIKVGHAGTLDPLAEGLMILCTGKKTKEIEKYQAQEKEYIATIKLGATTPSYDLETEIDKTFPIEQIDEKLLKEKINQFIGIQLQTPPTFSAKKINGQRVYKKARKGIHIDIQPQKIEISEIEILQFNLPELIIRIVCSKGTYIRALANDIGIALNSGAHLTGLQRTRIGQFTLEDALSLENFEKKLFSNNI